MTIQLKRTFGFQLRFAEGAITGRMRRLTRAEFLRLRPHLGKLDDSRSGEEQEADLRVVMEILGACVEELHGIEVDGREATLADLADDVTALQVMPRLTNALLDECTLTPEVEKKSAPPSPAPP